MGELRKVRILDVENLDLQQDKVYPELIIKKHVMEDLKKQGWAFKDLGPAIEDDDLKIIQEIKGNKGDTGPTGKSAYEVDVDNGYIGTEDEWFNSIINHNKKTNINDGTTYLHITKDELDTFNSYESKIIELFNRINILKGA